MIQSKDLRIGNWVKVDSIERVSDFYQIKAGWEIDDLGEHSGIPLTPEILKKAGFDDGFIFTSETVFCKEEEPDGKRFFLMYKNGFYFEAVQREVKLEYLHQLQNLYFILTGKELEIKL